MYSLYGKGKGRVLRIPSFIILLSIIGVTAGCNKKTAPEVKCIDIKGNLSEVHEMLGIPMEMIVCGDHILINDFQANPMIYVLDKNTFQKTGQFIHQGRGPGEFLPPVMLSVENEYLYVYDRNSSHLYRNPLDSLINHNSRLIDKILELDSRFSRSFCKLDETHFIFAGHFDKLFGIVDMKTGESVFDEDFPSYWEKEKNIPAHIRSMFHQFEFYKHPSKKVFAAVSAHVLYFYYFDGSDIERYNSILLDKYSYDYPEPGTVFYVRPHPDVVDGVIDGGGSEDYLYLIYSTNTKNNKGGKRKILVFDWNGNALAELYPEIIPELMAIDNKTIYLLDNTGETPLIQIFEEQDW